MQKNNKGITLIALIITIIVLLILAGVALNAIAGEDGILSNAENASLETQKANIKEQIEVAWLTSQTEYWQSTEDEQENFYTDDKINSYLGGAGTVSDFVKNEDGSFLGKYVNEKGDITYWFTIDNIGKVTLSTEELVVKYTVTFCDEDGTVLYTETVKKGNASTYDTEPTKDGFTFYDWVTEQGGWTSAVLNSITSNMTVYAQYNPLCFVAGTEVLTENGLVSIEDIKTGMKVYSKNMETGKVEKKEVVQTFIRYVDLDICKVYTKNGVVESTAGHEFYVKSKGWIDARDLETEDVLINSNNEEVKVEKIEVIPFEGNELNTVYNFEVEDNHNYYVGKDFVLVHNSGRFYLKKYES